MPHGAAAALQQRALDGEARVVIVKVGNAPAELVTVQQLRINAVQAHGIAAAGIGVALRVRVEDVKNPALAYHRVVVHLLLKALPEFQRQLVERDIAGEQIVGADDGGVAPDAARTEPGFFHDRDPPGFMIFGEVESRGQTMPPAADDHDVIGRSGGSIPPGRLPAFMPAESLAQHGEGGVFHGVRPGMGALRKFLIVNLNYGGE